MVVASMTQMKHADMSGGSLHSTTTEQVKPYSIAAYITDFY